MASMRMKKSDSKFGAPVGIYTGRFLGIFPFGDGTPRLGRDNKPMGPAVEWQFEITADPEHDGEHIGNQVGRITAAEPTTRNSCGALLKGLVGKEVGTEEDVDPDAFVGQMYQLVVSPNKENPEKTYVTQIVKVKGKPASPGTSKAAPPSPPAPPKPAAPKPPAASKRQPDPEPEYWFSHDGGDPVKLTATAVRQQIEAKTIDPDKTMWSHPDNPETWLPVAGSWVVDREQRTPPF